MHIIASKRSFLLCLRQLSCISSALPCTVNTHTNDMNWKVCLEMKWYLFTLQTGVKLSYSLRCKHHLNSRLTVTNTQYYHKKQQNCLGIFIETLSSRC